jgi:hypothetical protein
MRVDGQRLTIAYSRYQALRHWRSLLSIKGPRKTHGYYKEIQIEWNKEFVWDAIRDVGAIHNRVVPGFVVDCKLEGDWRIVRPASYSCRARLAL